MGSQRKTNGLPNVSDIKNNHIHQYQSSHSASIPVPDANFKMTMLSKLSSADFETAQTTQFCQSISAHKPVPKGADFETAQTTQFCQSISAHRRVPKDLETAQNTQHSRFCLDQFHGEQINEHKFKHNLD